MCFFFLDNSLVGMFWLSWGLYGNIWFGSVWFYGRIKIVVEIGCDVVIYYGLGKFF